MKANYRFPKSERLKQKRLFDALHLKANKELAHPLLVVWKRMSLPESVPVQIAFTAPKKHHKRAVDRNLLKRRLREAYRLNKSELLDSLEGLDTQLALNVIVLKSDNTSYDVLCQKLVVILRAIASKNKHV